MSLSSEVNIATKSNTFQLEELFNNLPLLIAYVDKNLTYRYVNSAYANYLPNFEKKDIENRKVNEVLTQQEFQKVLPLMEKVMKGEVVQYSRKSINSAREDIYLEGTLVPYMQGDSQNGFILITQNITEKVELLERTKKQEEDLIQQSKMAMVGEMIAAVAHQWKQPLHILSLYTQDIPDKVEFNELDKKEADELSNLMMEQINYMSDTITDFRNFFKPTNQQEEFSVVEAIKSVENLIKDHLLLDNINLQIQGEDAKVYGYCNEFKQAIINIVNNAKDAILEKEVSKSIINIDIHSGEHFVRVSIEDNGGGISEDILGKVFEQYVSTKGDKGTGIGLSLVKTIIEKMGGEISVENTNEGAKFTIILKRYKGGR